MNLETERLTLHPVSKQDLDLLNLLFNDAYVRKYLFDDNLLSHEQVQDILATSIKSFEEHKYGLWLISLKSTGSVIGFVGLWHFFNEEKPQLLYALLPEFAGRGYATESSQAIITFSFEQLGFKRIIASCDLHNTSSHRVAESIGMQKWKSEEVDGKILVFYGIDWKKADI